MGDMSREEKRRIMLEEIERLKGRVTPIEDETGIEWSDTVPCKCGSKARLVGERVVASVAEYRCETCGDRLLRMICGNRAETERMAGDG